jgi:hypothetical protein
MAIVGSCYGAKPPSTQTATYSSRLPEVTYPADFDVRYVSDGGQMRWNGSKIFVGRVLIGEPVGLEPCGDGLWTLWFSSYALGVFDERKLRIRARRKPTVKAPKIKT